jgi:hypothetical protein
MADWSARIDTLLDNAIEQITDSTPTEQLNEITHRIKKSTALWHEPSHHHRDYQKHFERALAKLANHLMGWSAEYLRVRDGRLLY